MALPSPALLPLQILFFLAIKARSTYIPLTSCGDTNYTSPSPYESNVLSLTANLTNSASSSSSFFSTGSIGSSPETQVFGLAQCRPDASAATCFDCLSDSATAAAANCPLRKSAAVRLQYCVLRYSDQHFFSMLEGLFMSTAFNPNNASDPVGFNNSVLNLMAQISPQAAMAESRFAVGVANYSELGDIYGMAWCTQDLSGSDCLQCLSRTVSGLKSWTLGAWSMMVSCVTRFESTSFFSLSFVPPPPLPPPPPPPPYLLPPPQSQVRPSTAAVSNGNGNSSKTTKAVLIIALPVMFASTLLCVFFVLLFRGKKRGSRRPSDSHLDQEEDMRSSRFLFFDLDTIIKATNEFSDENKLGQGGFGPVYKGVLEDGEQIAVKRLSRTSLQGFEEMKNEVAVVANLQHNNLVKLLGCCLEANEKLLVYEYLPKTSLDKYLFDPVERRKLDWGIRYKIIEGICRGLLHLHVDSCPKIIHRDLKASNILLDGNMRPKISDFGLARIFHMDQTQQNTSRIAGTCGYMAPEYAMHGLFSTKSDVFSYGVLVLEIITGKRNDVFTNGGHASDLPSYAWKHWNQGNGLQVADECLEHAYHPQEVLRCLHIGLLCVQDDSGLRPRMDSVVLMINSHSATFPAPSMPPFCSRSSTFETSE